MYMQRKKRAVMLGESVTALAIAALSIVCLMTGLNELNHQRKLADEQLAASRLAKEASDALKSPPRPRQDRSSSASGNR